MRAKGKVDALGDSFYAVVIALAMHGETSTRAKHNPSLYVHCDAVNAGIIEQSLSLALMG